MQELLQTSAYRNTCQERIQWYGTILIAVFNCNICLFGLKPDLRRNWRTPRGLRQWHCASPWSETCSCKSNKPDIAGKRHLPVNVSFVVEQVVKGTCLTVMFSLFHAFTFIRKYFYTTLKILPVPYVNSLYVITSRKIAKPKVRVTMLRYMPLKTHLDECSQSFWLSSDYILSSEMLSNWTTSILMHHASKANKHFIVSFKKISIF